MTVLAHHNLWCVEFQVDLTQNFSQGDWPMGLESQCYENSTPRSTSSSSLRPRLFRSPDHFLFGIALRQSPCRSWQSPCCSCRLLRTGFTGGATRVQLVQPRAQGCRAPKTSGFFNTLRSHRQRTGGCSCRSGLLYMLCPKRRLPQRGGRWLLLVK